MPRIEFLESNAGPAATIDFPDGGPLIDACDEAAAPIPFSCRSTSCGTCRVDVLEGSSLLDEVSAAERAVLELFDDEPGPRRLACTAHVRRGLGVVRLRACEEW
jgi:ferredoxin